MSPCERQPVARGADAGSSVGGVMTLRREYSLGHSEYNAFLFASVGEEKIGMPLTALTRLGEDPWLEAARLAGVVEDGGVAGLPAAHRTPARSGRAGPRAAARAPRPPSVA